MQLNQKQIEKLFVFVEKKGVKYYDVQHEIVDHLATSIESIMMESKSISFDQALYTVYSDYPITGFAQYTVDLEESLWTFWIRKILALVTIGYGFPTLALLACLTYSIYNTLVTNGSNALDSLFYGTTALGLIAVFIFARQFGRFGIDMMLYYGIEVLEDDLNDRLLYYRVLKIITLAVIFGSLFLSRIANIFVQDLNFVATEGLSNPILILSIFSSISVYWSLAVIFYFPNMIKDVIANKYNHVVIA